MMSAPKDIPIAHDGSRTASVHSRHTPISPVRSPVSSSPSSSHHFLIPSPIPTRRTRTLSVSEKAAAGPTLIGTIKNFCRQKGHGFITPHDGGTPLFVHISDVDGEYVPKEGDKVTYKTCLVPPKNEKYCAVHVEIVDMVPGVTHETWEPYSSHHS